MPVKGTNRDKLNKTDIYDLLVKMNDEYFRQHPTDYTCCVVRLLNPQHDCNIVFEKGCNDCIQKWLNSR